MANSNLTMEELLASQTQKLTILHRGQEVEGTVVSITDKEIILDLGAKSEGVLSKHDLKEPQLNNLKIGDQLKAFVYMQENEYGQTILTGSFSARLEGDRARRGGKPRGGRPAVNWYKFISAQNQKSKLQGKVLEVNKGGLIVEVGGIRGFLPNSQVGFELMNKAGQGMDKLIDQDLTVAVIEVDAENNKLIFSQRGQISEAVKTKLQSFKPGQAVTGKVVAILPFGLVVDAMGVEGLVFISDVSWDRVEDLSKLFTTGQEVEVKVLGLDEELGRLNLSIKQLTEDPFVKLAEQFSPDEVVKGEITGVSEAGVNIKLDKEVEGFLPGSKVTADSKYEVGKLVTFLVDGVDLHRRKINLAPFVTSTAGLIYK